MSRFEAELFCHRLFDCIIPSLDGNQFNALRVLLSAIIFGLEHYPELNNSLDRVRNGGQIYEGQYHVD